MAFEFGKIGVRVYPKTKGFARKLDRELTPLKKKRIEIPVVPELQGFKEKVESAAKTAARAVRNIRVKVVPQLDRSGFAYLEKRLHARNLPVNVKVDDDALRRVEESVRPLVLPFSLRRVGEQSLGDTAKVKVEADVDSSQVERQLRQVKARLGALREGLSLEVDAEKSETFYESVHRMIDYIEDQEAKLTAFVDPDTGYASARLKWLTRPRTVEVFAKINNASFAAVTAALGALSGARLSKDIAKDLKDFLRNIDRVTARVGVLGPLINTLGAGILASVSNLFVFGADLIAILPALNAVPGILAGAAVGAAGLIIPLLDIKDVLGDLEPLFTELRDEMSEAFWAGAEQPIRDLVAVHFPALAAGMRAVSASIGKQMGVVTKALSGALGGGVLERMFGYLLESIEIATDGMVDFTVGLVRLGEIGGQFLPGLARWFNDIAASFRNWAETADVSGAISRGVTMLGHLWRSLVNVAAMFAAVTKAAREAGGSGLAEFEGWTRRAADALNGVAAQTALTTYFKGAHDAMRIFLDGWYHLGDALTAFADTAAVMLTKSAEAVVSFFALIDGVLSNSGFQGAVERMFQGIADGAEALAGHASSVAVLFGAMADAVGAFAPVLGEVLGAGLDLMGPLFREIADAALALAPVLGDLLVSAFEWLRKNILPVVEAISDWVQENPKLATGLLLVAAALGGLVAVVGPALMSLFGVLDVIGPLIAEGGILHGVFTSVAGSIAGISAPVWGAIAGGLALVAALVTLYASSEQFRNALAQLWEALVGFIQPIIDALLPGLTLIGEGFMSLLETAWNAFDDIATKVVESAALILEGLTPLTEFLGGVLGAVFTWLGDIVKTVFDIIVDIISGAADIIINLLDAFIGLLSADWEKMGNSMMNVSRSVWELITNLWDGALNLLKKIFGPPISFIVGLFRDSMDTMPGFVKDALNNVKSFFVDGFDNVRGAVANGVDGVLNFFRNLPGKVRNAIGDLGQTLYNSGRSLMIGLNNGIINAFNQVRDNIKGALQKIRNFFPFSPAKEGPFSGTGYTTYSGKAMISDWAKSMRDQVAREATTFGASLSPLQAEFSGTQERKTVIEGIQRAEPFSASMFREALEGMGMRLDTEAGVMVARLNHMGQRGLR